MDCGLSYRFSYDQLLGAREREFKDLVGVWAHTSAACSDYTSGKVDRLPDRVSKTPYELIGICTNGVELLYQPVGCRTNASNVEGVPRVEVDSLCSVKDYAPKGGHFRIEATVRTRSHSMSRTLLATSRSRATTSAASATTYVATG